MHAHTCLAGKRNGVAVYAHARTASIVKMYPPPPRHPFCVPEYSPFASFFPSRAVMCSNANETNTMYAPHQMLKEMQDEQRAMDNNPAEMQAQAHASAVKRFTGGGFAVN